MARLLYPRDSAPLIKSAVRRHLRLCRKNGGGDAYISALTPSFNQFKVKHDALLLAGEAREDAYDDIMLADNDLDNQIRNSFDACKQFDRDNSGLPVLKMVFPNGSFSEIVRMPYSDEPGEADKIALRIESLGTSHVLFPLVEGLRTKIKAVRDSIEAHNTTIRSEKMAEADFEIAKSLLVRQYEYNYLDTRKALGVTNADKLFPRLGARVKEESAVESAVQAAETVQ